MPIYEYACARCGERFDRIQSNPDGGGSCPRCGGEEARRLISVIAGLGGGSAEVTSGCGCGGACACGRN